ncbi:MAG TPA: ABC transporter permease, partial [Candidatus Omnitrophota bacterium]|nr:ABC transporter permease [Candidatus Omnitrophota bacterium]
MINLIEPLRIAIGSLFSNKLRSILTTMGVIIGVAAVITLVSMGEGAKNYILTQIGSWGMGANSLLVHPGAEGSMVPTLSITYEDEIALKQKVRHLQYLMPEFVGRGRIEYGKNSYSPAYTMGASADYPLAYKQKAADGRFFTAAEDEGRKHLIVIGKTVARKLFGEYSPIGETVKVNGIGFTVAGVLEEKGTMLTEDMDDIALIPSSLSGSVLGTTKIWEIFMTVEKDDQVEGAIVDVKKILISRHHKEDFHLHTQQGMIDII